MLSRMSGGPVLAKFTMLSEPRMPSSSCLEFHCLKNYEGIIFERTIRRFYTTNKNNVFVYMITRHIGYFLINTIDYTIPIDKNVQMQSKIVSLLFIEHLICELKDLGT